MVGLSARMLAEAAQRDGCEVMSLDLFGDRDTRQASVHWQPVGDPSALRISDERLLQGLAAAAEWGACGWLAGSGLDGRADLLARGAQCLPLLGTPPDRVAALRHPQRFFSQLQAWGIPFPEVALRRPADPGGWWLKDAGACGGWHIRAARADDADPPNVGWYWQRHSPGRPMSMALLAAGERVRLLGVHEQIVQARGGHPFVFHGVVGPLNLGRRLMSLLQEVAERLVQGFGLRGLVGVDFLLQGEDDIRLLELNPRPPASLGLYATEGGWIRAHLAACLHGELPEPAGRAAAQGEGRLRGLSYVFARRPLQLDEARWQRLLGWPGAHDLPAAPLHLAAGEPLCTLDAETDADDTAASVPRVRQALAAAATALLNDLETTG